MSQPPSPASRMDTKPLLTTLIIQNGRASVHGSAGLVPGLDQVALVFGQSTRIAERHLLQLNHLLVNLLGMRLHSLGGVQTDTLLLDGSAVANHAMLLEDGIDLGKAFATGCCRSSSFSSGCRTFGSRGCGSGSLLGNGRCRSSSHGGGSSHRSGLEPDEHGQQSSRATSCVPAVSPMRCNCSIRG